LQLIVIENLQSATGDNRCEHPALSECVLTTDTTTDTHADKQNDIT